MFKKIKDYFIGDLLTNDLGTIQYANITVVYYVCVSALSLLFPLIITYIIDGLEISLYIGSVSFVVFLLSLFLIKFKKNIVFVSHFMVSYSSLIYVVNLIVYTNITIVNGLLLACNLLFVFNLFKRSTAIGYLAFSFISTVLYIVSKNLGLLDGLFLAIDQPLAVQLTSFVLLMLMVVVLIVHYQIAHKVSESKLQTSLNALKISEGRRKRSQAVGHIGHWEYDVATDKIVFDEESFKIFGLAPVVDLSFGDFKGIIHKSDWEAAKKAAFEMVSIGSISIEFRVVHKTGVERFLSIYGELQYNSNKEPYRCYGILQDVTERKKFEYDQHRLLEVTNQQNGKLRNFTYIVSHNIRSHSSNITSLVDLLSDITNEDEKTKVLKMLKNTASNLEETLHNLNEIVSITENIEEKVPRKLLTAINSTLNVLSAQIVQNDIKLNVDVSSKLDVAVIPPYLDSLLLNLIGNAIKYRSNERIAQIDICTYKAKGFLVLSIKDNGLGIDLAKYGSKIFGMYKTFHGNKDAKGIGLFITKTQIEAMGGRIEVQSEVGQWTEFKVFFNEKD